MAFWHHHHHEVIALAPTAIAARATGEILAVDHDTLHGAMRRWQRGENLPVPGDLVLIDEASMAATATLLAAARTATNHGATVRLVGDPRQLKAVGAGGGLALVAEATNAPELSQLHRFDHPWEAQATLGLRRGDPSALDAYFAHDRIRADLDHTAIAATLRAWAHSPAGNHATIMVASDNHTVRQLNNLARARARQRRTRQRRGCDPHDDTTAGIGGHHRHPQKPAPPPPSHQKRRVGDRNRDRWHLKTVNVDGTVTVTDLPAPTRVTLPADYVSKHVQLGYADTGHGVQGRTVERAEILVRPGDTRWYLYVAMSRARQHTVAHVVIDRLDHEPLYKPGRTARRILKAILANDEPVSLTDHQRLADDAAANPARLYDRYRHTQTEDLRHRLTQTLHDLGAGQLLHCQDSWQLTGTALAIEQAGLDAQPSFAPNQTTSPSPSRLAANNSTTPATTRTTPTDGSAPQAGTPASSPNLDPTSIPTSPTSSTPSANNSSNGGPTSLTPSPQADRHPHGLPPRQTARPARRAQSLGPQRRPSRPMAGQPTPHRPATPRAQTPARPPRHPRLERRRPSRQPSPNDQPPRPAGDRGRTSPTANKPPNTRGPPNRHR